MISQNFKLNEDKTELIGISQVKVLEFFKRFASSHLPHKMYVLKIVEVNHSQRSRNYLFAILSEYAKELGYSVDNLEKIMLQRLDDHVRSGESDLYSREVFFGDSAVDPGTGESLESKLKSLSKFSNTAMSLFISFVITTINEIDPDFIIPNPEEYQFAVEGKRNQIRFPEEKISLK